MLKHLKSRDISRISTFVLIIDSKSNPSKKNAWRLPFRIVSNYMIHSKFLHQQSYEALIAGTLNWEEMMRRKAYHQLVEAPPKK